MCHVATPNVFITLQSDEVGDIGGRFDHHIFPGRIGKDLPDLVAHLEFEVGGENEPVRAASEFLAVGGELSQDALVAEKAWVWSPSAACDSPARM